MPRGELFVAVRMLRLEAPVSTSEHGFVARIAGGGRGEVRRRRRRSTRESRAFQPNQEDGAPVGEPRRQAGPGGAPWPQPSTNGSRALHIGDSDPAPTHPWRVCYSSLRSPIRPDLRKLRAGKSRLTCLKVRMSTLRRPSGQLFALRSRMHANFSTHLVNHRHTLQAPCRASSTRPPFRI